MPLFSLLSISELVTSVAFHWYIRCILVGINAQVKQYLLWMTCTGHHWLITLWIMIGAN